MKNIFLLSILLSAFTLNIQASGGGGGGGGSRGGGGGGGSFRGGGFSGGGERDPSKVSTARFEKGQAVFEGTFEASSRVSLSIRNSQSRNLVQLMRRLAKKSKAAAKLLDVEKLAGSMSPNDFRALRYYLDVRYLKTEKYDSEYNEKKKKKSR